jgi:hypothetical protein
MTSRAQLLAFTPHASGSLIGFADVELPSGMRVHGTTVHRQGSAAWANPPGKPQIANDGTVAREQNGKIAYSAVISFKDSATRRRFSDTVPACLSEAGIDVLAEAEGPPLAPLDTREDVA